MSVSARRTRTRDALLAVLAEHGTVSRADLSRLSGLSRSAVSSAVAELLADGQVTEDPAQAAPGAGRGRRPTGVSLRRGAGVVLALDLGHAHISAAVATTAGVIIAEEGAALDVDNRPQEALDAVVVLADRALERSGHRRSDLAGVAAGVPAVLDPRTGVVRAPTKLSRWLGMNPGEALARALGRPVEIGNDAELGARGERAYGAARGIDDLIYVKASHGIGAGLVLGGRVYVGATGASGEIGHIQLPGAANLCRCGNRGCLETVVSIGDVRRQLLHVLLVRNEEDLPPLAELSTEPAAARVITETGRTLGRVLADLVNVLNPAAIVIGGELGLAGAPLVAGVRESVDRYAQPVSVGAVDVRASALGLKAELYGAITAAAEQARRA
ncbi:ROK family transcriptional regulator [Kitasatospora paracochleata]|uniref:NBD/HSP70 family sugar kinase n=1 Tax=Kitasatospora paracochleata TaxID=58354 RepID=A0ABT1J1Z6_9ACTN|nr:ROK family transcriptional regulator [Kitasatospora paracochleata]MCP2311453.1 putative NBD/HSP70 family sugar kinase [Kitasatospora paracochleata]